MQSSSFNSLFGVSRDADFDRLSSALCSRSVPPFEEAQCTMPKFFPGDIVTTVRGEIGIIVKAHVIINGCEIEWNGKLPDRIEHGWSPDYALDAIPGFPPPHKYAWWRSSEWAKVRVMDIPDDVDWEIHQYDGIESIHEKHRSW